MTAIELTQSRIPPYDHQRIGVVSIVKNPYFFLADEMGAGKSKQTIDAAQVLFTQGEITRVVIVAPAAVRSVWYDQELGELAKHLWLDIPSRVTEYHARMRFWLHGPDTFWKTEQPRKVGEFLQWIITNYDFIRKDRLKPLLKVCGPRTFLVLDESSSVKNASAKQTRACMKLRKKSGRILLLNGTPIANSPMDMFSQGNIMSDTILDCPTQIQFRSRYAQMGGFEGRQIVGWHDLEDLQRRFAPYVLRRLKKDCLDLPEKLPPVTLTATLTPATWKIYKEMRDEFVAWLDAATGSEASQSVVKALRLAQITSGFLGGVKTLLPDTDLLEPQARPSWLPFDNTPLPPLVPVDGDGVRELSYEKHNVFLEWLDARLEEDPSFKVLVWCRFRPEVLRLQKTLNGKQRLAVGLIFGSQKREARETALRLLDPRTTPSGPVVVIGTPHTGSKGLNLTATSTVLYLSNDYSLETRQQSEDRVHRPGQIHPVSYFDVIAVGPQGQRTIDHTILKALHNKEELASWTTGAWRKAIRDEIEIFQAEEVIAS